MYDFPNATIVYSTNRLEDLESKIKEIKFEHKRLNRNCEVEVIPKPDPGLITFDGYTNIQFQLSIYIRHLSVN
ncbi:hypothetical protein [Clostridium kluyveri]|uniref:Uncharacterized protein n=1 Tax=Clostridium kluyveri TaxID=1534 RepID=A0A1L5FAV0_CLOKL|nr:hypothetical protein [Clostridium kluyveri]APM40129.1 hypothetical protein BS101_15955 [Clostridium kluyveri]UZQ49633.1 hypothetical protein OP486_17035 [Clostridium kluyveri]